MGRKLGRKPTCVIPTRMGSGGVVGDAGSGARGPVRGGHGSKVPHAVDSPKRDAGLAARGISATAIRIPVSG